MNPTQEDFTNAFVSILSGIAEWHNEKEVIHKKDDVEITTFEFPSNSPEKVISRKYNSKKQIIIYAEFENELLNGNRKVYSKGYLVIHDIYEDGKVIKIIY